MTFVLRNLTDQEQSYFMGFLTNLALDGCVYPDELRKLTDLFDKAQRINHEDVEAMSPLEHLYARLKDLVRIEKDGHWLFTGKSIQGSDRPVIKEKGRVVSLRAFLIQELRGLEVPEKARVDRMCGTRLCVYPEHMRVKTQEGVIIWPPRSLITADGTVDLEILTSTPATPAELEIRWAELHELEAQAKAKARARKEFVKVAQTVPGSPRVTQVQEVDPLDVLLHEAGLVSQILDDLEIKLTPP